MSDSIFKSGPGLIHVHELSKIYSMGEVVVRALNGVSVDIYESEFIVLLGASGSGKSTLLNIIGGLDSVSSGEVCFGDLDLVSANEKKLTEYRRAHVGFVFQFYNLIPSLTALENVEVVTDISPDPMKAEEALSLVGLADRMDHFPSQLSGGEQQRIAIARAIAKQPTLLLCDEPTGALDSKTGVVVLEALEKINRELGTAVIVITHNATIAEMADRVIYLSDGKISRIEENSSKKSPLDMSW